MTEFVQLTLDLNISSIFYFLQTQKIDFCLHVEFLWAPHNLIGLLNFFCYNKQVSLQDCLIHHFTIHISAVWGEFFWEEPLVSVQNSKYLKKIWPCYVLLSVRSSMTFFGHISISLISSLTKADYSSLLLLNPVHSHFLLLLLYGNIFTCDMSDCY